MLFSSFRLLRSLLLACLLCWLISGCAEKKKAPTPLPAEQTKPASVKTGPAIVSSVPKTQPALAQTVVAKPEDETDHSCSYFYFLWGRHAEFETKYEAALEAYEKALICDPQAEFVTSKLPLLLLRMNRNSEAAAKLQEQLDKQPEDVDSRMLLAKIFIREGKLDEAAAQCRTAHDLNPQNTAPLLLLSELHLAANKKDLAKEALEKVLQVDNSSASAHLLLARLLAAEEKFTKALEHYRQALNLSAVEGVQLEMADVLVRQKKYRQAIKTYQELLAQNEQNEEARIGLIHVYLLQNKEKKAAAELKLLKERADSPERADLTIAKLYIRWEDYAKAIALLKELLTKEDIPEARHLLGALYFQEKKYEEALAALGKITPEEEEYEDALIIQVRTLRELKRQDEAIKLLKGALEQDQLGPDVWGLLAGLYQEAGQEDACLKTFACALKMHPGNELLLYEYGLALEQVGKKKQALSVMQKLLKKNPDHAGALNYIGYSWAERKVNLNKAFLYLSRAKELKPEDGSIHDSLGWVYYRLGKFEEALKMLEVAARLSPDDPAVFDHLAETHLAAGHKQEAVQAWQKALELLTKQKEGEGNTKRQERLKVDCKRLEEKIDRLEKEKK
ncbi:tetratricopeptide repeat protein [Candidatus Electronema sp. PJ]|uniref:tetratricopeptide repeat protein n=1 Tax=Candidatus Electronema sp. PJ TaxID=3401572 RepID=UPI003AA82596